MTFFWYFLKLLRSHCGDDRELCVREKFALNSPAIDLEILQPSSAETTPPPAEENAAEKLKAEQKRQEEEEAEMRQQLILKQKELLKLEQQRLELELAETKARLEQQKQENLNRRDVRILIHYGIIRSICQSGSIIHAFCVSKNIEVMR